jgi:ribosomal protein L11 methyltransferase
VLIANNISGAQVIDNSDLRQLLDENPLTWDYIDESLLESQHDYIAVEFYVPPDEGGQDKLLQISDCLKNLSLDDSHNYGDLSLTVETVNDESWLHEWKKYFKPIRVGKRIVIIPAWENYTPCAGDVIFTVDPGSVFGTGQHQSTQLCAEALEDYIKLGHTLLDIGCGSGILSIIGLLLGVETATACDFDPSAWLAVRENLRLNPSVDTSRLQMFTGDFFTAPNIQINALKEPFDVITANIVADPIIKLASMVRQLLKPNGVFIASGIIHERLADVLDAFRLNNLTLLRVRERDGWFCTVAG